MMSVPISSDSTIDLEAAKNRVMGDMEFLKEMLEEFHGSIPSFLETIQKALRNQDAVLLSKTAHQLKGAALSLSLNRISTRAATLNELGRQENFEKTETAMQELESAVLDFEEYLESLVIGH